MIQRLLCLITIPLSFVLPGCAVLEIEVHAYSGPLANDPHTQLEQAVSFARNLSSSLRRLANRDQVLLEEAIDQSQTDIGNSPDSKKGRLAEQFLREESEFSVVDSLQKAMFFWERREQEIEEAHQDYLKSVNDQAKREHLLRLLVQTGQDALLDNLSTEKYYGTRTNVDLDDEKKNSVFNGKEELTTVTHGEMAKLLIVLADGVLRHSTDQASLEDAYRLVTEAYAARRFVDPSDAVAQWRALIRDDAFAPVREAANDAFDRLLQEAREDNFRKESAQNVFDRFVELVREELDGAAEATDRLALISDHADRFLASASIHNLAAGQADTAGDVLNRYIKQLEFERIELLKGGGNPEGDIAGIEAAIDAANNLQVRSTSIRPALSVLRSLPDKANEDRFKNLLSERTHRANAIWGAVGLTSPPEEDKTIYGFLSNLLSPKDASSWDSTEYARFWVPVNTIRVSGAVNSNIVIAKDDIGNWGIRRYSSNKDALYETMAKAVVGATSSGTVSAGSAIVGLSKDVVSSEARDSAKENVEDSRRNRSEALDSLKAQFIEDETMFVQNVLAAASRRTDEMGSLYLRELLAAGLAADRLETARNRVNGLDAEVPAARDSVGHPTTSVTGAIQEYLASSNDASSLIFRTISGDGTDAELVRLLASTRIRIDGQTINRAKVFTRDWLSAIESELAANASLIYPAGIR